MIVLHFLSHSVATLKILVQQSLLKQAVTRYTVLKTIVILWAAVWARYFRIALAPIHSI